MDEEEKKENKNKGFKDGFNVGTVIIRNGTNVLNEYHGHHDGLVATIVRRTGNVIAINYLTTLLNVKGEQISGDAIYPDNIEDIIVREPITDIIRKSIIGGVTNDKIDETVEGK